MATINVNGVEVELRTKSNLVQTLGEMTEDCSNKIKGGKIKTNANRRTEMATLSFFGSINHYMKGGEEV